MKQKMKSQKPIKVDASFRYACTNNSCNLDHWLFLREVQTKNFKVVCDCGTVFKPKRIKNIRIVYAKSESVKTNIDKSNKSDTYDSHIVRRAIKTMIQLGFTKQESLEAIGSIDNKDAFNDHILLAKTAISKLGGI